ncbi:prepilin-type N-terminal cleavage/methylation domain-containing protein [Fructobacillus cardui]|nr:prepilin-type N-terminal cleavage/methylation domain-containing protein [Fructobacillus cardui]MCK8626952.1 prepilin-type N-terminal cleavage/methylation domain-containing protein [Fructobacillus cardui]
MTAVQSKNSRNGFTMVEAILALVVAAMVFEALMVILPQSKRGADARYAD